MRSVGSIKVSRTHSPLNLLLTARTVWLLMEAARMFAIRGTALIIRNILICKHKRIVKCCQKRNSASSVPHCKALCKLHSYSQ